VRPGLLMAIAKEQVVWILCGLLAAAAGITDWRSRRIPNWLTVSGALLGIVVNAWVSGWYGVRESLLGMLLGLAILLPFVLVRSLGAGDWKLIGAVGAFIGPQQLLVVLLATILVAGVMALGLLIWKRRFRQTLRNIGRMLLAFLRFHLPGQELSLDNPEALKVPFGVAAAIAVVLYSVGHVWGVA
jgi:prepilin peptidase CpaA